jgi:hypothetical protein
MNMKEKKQIPQLKEIYIYRIVIAFLVFLVIYNIYSRSNTLSLVKKKDEINYHILKIASEKIDSVIYTNRMLTDLITQNSSYNIKECIDAFETCKNEKLKRKTRSFR